MKKKSCHSKLNLEVSVRLHVCVSRLSLCGPVLDWRPVQGVPASHPMTAGIGSSSPVTLNWIKRV